MSYQPGRMGMTEGTGLVFVTTFASFFLSTWSVFMDISTTATWMIPLVIMVGGTVILFLLLYVLRYTSGDFFSACDQLFGKTVTRLFTLYYIVVFLLDAGLLLRQYSENTLLTALPFIDFELVSGWYTLVITAILFIGISGIEQLARVSYIFLPVAIISILAVLALNTPQYNYLYLTPWNGPGLTEVLKLGILRLGVNLGIIVPIILASSFQNARTVMNAVLYGSVISAILRTMVVACYIAAFGQGVAQEKVLPFFELTRLVFINRFIQRIEALFILVWAIMGILAIAIEVYVAVYLLGRLFNLPTLRPLFIPVMIIVSQLSLMPREITGVMTFHSFLQASVFDIGTVIIPLILAAGAFFHARRSKKCRLSN